MISGFLDSYLGGSSTPEGRLASELAGAYFRHKLVDRGVDWLFQKAMPTTTADYARATNEDEPFITTAPTLAGKQVLQTINEDLISSLPMRHSIYGALPPSNGRGMLGLGINMGAKSNVIPNVFGSLARRLFLR